MHWTTLPQPMLAVCQPSCCKERGCALCTKNSHSCWAPCCNHTVMSLPHVMQLPCSDLGLSSLYHQMLGQTGQTSVGDTTTGRLSDAASSRCNSRSGSRANSRRGSVADAGASSELQAAAAGLGRSNSSFSLSMTGQAAVSLYGDLFRWYDRNRSGLLEKDELQVGLSFLKIR